MKTYNVKLTTTIAPSTEGDTEDEDDDSTQKKGQFSSFGIVFDEGRQLAMEGLAGVSSLRKITETEMEEILNDCDPIEAPPGEYKIQPEKQGKGIKYFQSQTSSYLQGGLSGSQELRGWASPLQPSCLVETTVMFTTRRTALKK